MSRTARRDAISPGAYAERGDPRVGWFDTFVNRAGAPVARRFGARIERREAFVGEVAEHGATLGGIDDAALRAARDEVRERLRRHGFERAAVARAFAVVRETATRTIGQRHFDVQLIGGLILLRGMVAEMDTGEGKTLTATLPAATAALAGLPVHIITVNDYLAARDAEALRPLYEALGLTVGVIVGGLDPDSRRAAYACDITYCTNKEITFDYLKDRITLGGRPSKLQLHVERLAGAGGRMRKLLLRGLHYAIVDEADSVLVDEARVPLIISGGQGEAPAQKLYHEALELARQLEAGRDYEITTRHRMVELMDDGRARLAALVQPLGGLWTGQQRREELATQALTALHLFERDIHYLVKDGKVQIVDEFTGRVSADRSWERGLHQLIEVKEEVEVTNRTEPLARISYQRFFRRYLLLAGMTGTAREVADEMWAVYRLPVRRVPTNRPVVRRPLPDRLYATVDAKWSAIVEHIARLHAEGRPVLVGTRSVAASEHLSGLLTASGITHEVLNARQDRGEAEIVAQAGERGRVTVATNMAGRGTDIKLGEGIREMGGLHVIATERHEAGRIDRQLFGRCGRQGDPGSYEVITSLQDELVRTFGGGLGRLAARSVAGLGPTWADPVGGLVVRRAQRVAERLHSRMRRELLRYDEQLEATLAFAGRFE
jgi:preprotein translocase subunit SecA